MSPTVAQVPLLREAQNIPERDHRSHAEEAEDEDKLSKCRNVGVGK